MPLRYAAGIDFKLFQASLTPFLLQQIAKADKEKADAALKANVSHVITSIRDFCLLTAV